MRVQGRINRLRELNAQLRTAQEVSAEAESVTLPEPDMLAVIPN